MWLRSLNTGARPVNTELYSSLKKTKRVEFKDEMNIWGTGTNDVDLGIYVSKVSNIQ